MLEDGQPVTIGGPLGEGLGGVGVADVRRRGSKTSRTTTTTRSCSRTKR